MLQWPGIISSSHFRFPDKLIQNIQQVRRANLIGQRWNGLRDSTKFNTPDLVPVVGIRDYCRFTLLLQCHQRLSHFWSFREPDPIVICISNISLTHTDKLPHHIGFSWNRDEFSSQEGLLKCIHFIHSYWNNLNNAIGANALNGVNCFLISDTCP